MTSIEFIVTNAYASLSQSEQAAATYFLQHKEHIFQYPLAKLAKMSGTSQGAWVRFCKAIGFDGLKGLKNALFQETNQANQTNDAEKVLPLFSDIKEFHSLQTLAEHIASNSIQAIRSTLRIVDADTLEQIVTMLIDARSIRCFGVGASGLVAEDLTSKFLRLGYSCLYSEDLHTGYTLAAASSPQDVAILFSNSGKTMEILKIADILNAVGTPVIAVTGCTSGNLLVSHADYILYTNSAEVLKRSSATSSRIAQLCIVDLLFMATANRDYENIESKLKLTYDSCHNL